MEIEILEKSKKSLCAYKNGNLLFYSTLKPNWTSRIVAIYNQNNDLLLELKCKSFFMKSNYKILFQSELLIPSITEINGISIFFDQDKHLTIISKHYISFNYNYYFKKNKIAELKKKILSSSNKMIIDINDDQLEFLNQIIIHVLSIETGVSVD